MSESKLPEPWLRGSLQEVPAVQRGVLHALELAGEDVTALVRRLERRRD